MNITCNWKRQSFCILLCLLTLSTINIFNANKSNIDFILSNIAYSAISEPKTNHLSILRQLLTYSKHWTSETISFQSKSEVQLLNETNIFTTGFGLYQHSNCPLKKLKYHCFDGPHPFDYSLVATLNSNHHQTTQQQQTNAYHDFMQRLSTRQSVFDKEGSNVLLFGNSHIKQIYESLQCILLRHNLLKTRQNPNASIVVKSRINYELSTDNFTFIPCMATDSDSFVASWTNKQYKTRKDLRERYLKLTAAATGDEIVQCDDVLCHMHFASDDSNIYYSFQHNQQHKSLVNDINLFSEKLKVSNESFIRNLNVIVMNLGNYPFYDWKSDHFMKELEVINGFRQHNISVIATGDFIYNVLWAVKYQNMYDDLLCIDMSNITDSLRKDEEWNSVIDNRWDNKWHHFCMPSVPEHFMLLLIESINAIISSKNGTVLNKDSEKEIF